MRYRAMAIGTIVVSAAVGLLSETADDLAPGDTSWSSVRPASLTQVVPAVADAQAGHVTTLTPAAPRL